MSISAMPWYPNKYRAIENTSWLVFHLVKWFGKDKAYYYEEFDELWSGYVLFRRFYVVNVKRHFAGPCSSIATRYWRV